MGKIKENNPPPIFYKWTDQDEQKLHDIHFSKIDMNDTVLGRIKASCTYEFEASFSSLTH